MVAPLFQLSNPQFGDIGCSEWQFFSFPHQKLYSWTPSLSDLKHTMRVIYIWSKAEYRIVFQFPPFYMKNVICISLWTYVFRYIHSLTKYNKACCKRKSLGFSSFLDQECFQRYNYVRLFRYIHTFKSRIQYIIIDV